MHGKRILILAIVVAGMLAATRAEAEEVHLSYDAPAGCPDRAAFVAQVASRTSKAVWIPRRDDARSFDITVTVTSAGSQGKLVIVDPTTPTPASREVPGQSCEDVVAALALITALAIDPDAALIPPPPPDPPPPPPPDPPEPDPPPPPKPPEPEPPKPEPAPPKPPKPPPIRLVKPPRWRWLLGFGVHATSGLGDKLAVVVPGFLDVALDSSDWLAPSFRLGVSVMPDRVITHPAGRGHLSRFTAQLAGCPIKVSVSLLVVRPCASFEAGALVARGEAIEQPHTSATPWVAVGAGLRLQVFPADWLSLEVNTEAGISLVRPRFIIAPRIEVTEGELIFGVLGGALGVRFP